MDDPNQQENTVMKQEKICYKTEKPLTKGWDSSWKEKLIIWTVFALTGSSTALVVRPFIKNVLQLRGNLKDGPNRFRFAYLLLTIPIYSILLLTFGALFGRFEFFMRFTFRMWSRFSLKGRYNR